MLFLDIRDLFLDILGFAKPNLDSQDMFVHHEIGL